MATEVGDLKDQLKNSQVSKTSLANRLQDVHYYIHNLDIH